MSAPGGPPGWHEQRPPGQVDPLMGRPLEPNAGQAEHRPEPYFGGYQGPSDYQGLGIYQTDQDEEPPVPRPNQTPLVIAVVVAVLLAGGGAAAFLLLGRDENSAAPAGPAPSTTRQTATTQEITTTPRPSTTKSKIPDSVTPSTVEEIRVDAVKQGWQGVLSPKEQVAYDVPANWEVDAPGVLSGYQYPDGRPRALVHGVSTYKPNVCGRNSYRAKVGFMTAKDIPPAQAASRGAKVWAESAGELPEGSYPAEQVSQPRTVELDDGRFQALRATTTVRLPQSDSCPTPSMRIDTVAFQHNGQTVLFVVRADQEVADAAQADTIDKMIASLRPYSG